MNGTGQKGKYTFRHAKNRLLYLAGFSGLFDGEERFVILTGEAGPSMAPVHDRQPLTLEGEELSDWLFRPDRLEDFLHKQAAEFRREAEYEQMRFDLG